MMAIGWWYKENKEDDDNAEDSIDGDDNDATFDVVAGERTLR